MAVKNQRFEMYAANRKTLRFTIKQTSAAGSPPQDLTGSSLKFALSRLDSSGNYQSTPVLDKSTAGGGIVVTDAPNGVAEVRFLPPDTSNALLGQFYFELEFFDPSSNPTVVATGVGTILRNVVNA